MITKFKFLADASDKVYIIDPVNRYLFVLLNKKSG